MKQLLKKASFAIGVMFCSMNILCEDIDEPVDDDYFCGYEAVIDADLYENLQSAEFQAIHAEIFDDCLSIEIGASGCDGSTWEFKLVDSGAVAESLPEQRFLKLQPINTELCDAFFERTISFDLTPLRIDNSVNEVVLHVDGFEGTLSYRY